MRFVLLLCVLSILVFSNCESSSTAIDGPLPRLGHRFVDDAGDTIYHTVPDFAFLDQDSFLVTNEHFKDRAYIVDFFFTSCPTICPKVKQQMIKIFDAYKEEPKLGMVSHSIDYRKDSIPVLKKYSLKLNINDNQKWHFVTGQKDAVYDLADDYFIAVQEDPDAPGGFDHSGKIILVDKYRHVRAFCDGTDPEAVDEFLHTIQLLLDEG